jgi:opacity protein-like surface antigen
MTFAMRIAFLLTATAIPFGGAFAADYEPPIVIDEAPEVVPVEVGSGWYLRGDLGYVVASETDDFLYRTFDPASGTYGQGRLFGDMENPFTVGAGIGYHFNDLLRADLTVDGMVADFNGKSFSDGPCLPALAGTSCRSEDSSEMSAISFMANGYVDLGTFAGFTPYVGAGAGYTFVTWETLNSDFYCVGGNCGGASYLGHTENGGTDDWRFTWQAMAGVAYAINRNLKLDVGYRYREIDKGDMFKWDFNTTQAGATGFQGRDGGLTQHEVRVGLRYDLW